MVNAGEIGAIAKSLHLVDNRLKIELGTESGIRENAERMRFILSFIWFPLAIACYFLARSAHILNQEFIRRSNGEDIDS